MSETLRKGWCPGALRPMAAKDGLLVRLRITCGILPAPTAHALADLAAHHGNGLFDLSARGNLQLRGIRDAALGALHHGLRDLGLLDADVASESVRNVIASPLAGLQDGLDIRPIVAALETRLRTDSTLHALPGKFGFLIDDGGLPSLADIASDVRFDWIGPKGHFAIGLAGTRRDAVPIGVCAPAELAAHATLIAHGMLALLAGSPDCRRMRDLVTALGADVVARACGGIRGQAGPVVVGTKARDVVGLQTDGAYLGLAAPFGRLDAAMLHTAAACAARTPLRELRLTPWRAILIPGASRDTALPGFIIDAADPRLAVAACVGADGCTRGTTTTHDDATRLAAHVPAFGHDIALHVSGCAKGCAKPSRSAITLVARDGLYDLVRDGRAGDPPMRSGLDLTHAILELA